MKILEVMPDAKIILVDLEATLGDKKQNASTLCVQYKGKIITLNTAYEGRPILMKEENAIKI